VNDGLRPGAALLPLRLFLGGTFVYAGIQKLTDPGFLHQGAPTYIGAQLHNFASGTPGGFILRAFALPHPGLAGAGVAVTEIFVGLLVFFGLATRWAAAVGLGLNALLFLTASWKTSPYFLGSDIVFVFAWLPFVLAGASGQPALDHALERSSPALERRMRMRPDRAVSTGPGTGALSRRTLLAEFGAAALALSGIAALLKGAYRGPAVATAGAGGAAAPTKATASTTRTAATTSKPPSGAVKLGPSARLGTGQAATYPDPADGSPDIVIRQSSGDLTAFSAVCTHAGCTVSYQGGEIFCPCHGATYNAQTGAVEGGPAPSGLAPRKVLEQAGSIYAVPS
jgi:thiosulfate dehydrogenase (quinone) large subunit